MRLISIIAFIFSMFSACFADTGNSYYPMTAGTSITYLIIPITGTYDPASQQISILTRDYPNSYNQVISYSPHAYDSYLPLSNLNVDYYHSPGTPDTPPSFPAGTLQENKWVMPSNFAYIGEMVNNLGNVVIPPEAKIPASPVAGEALDTTSVVRRSPTDNTIINGAYHWRYRTIEHVAQWGAFTDCWHTGLIEYGPTNQVYNYVFMNGKGMVDFWFGAADANNHVVGLEYYAVS